MDHDNTDDRRETSPSSSMNGNGPSRDNTAAHRRMLQLVPPVSRKELIESAYS